MARTKLVVFGAMLGLLVVNASPATASSQYLRDIGRPATAEMIPRDVARDASGNWYVLDENMDCVKEYAPDRTTLVRTFFTCWVAGLDLSHLTDPTGIGIDTTARRLWVANVSRVLMVDLASGTVTSTTLSDAPAPKVSVKDVTVDSQGNAYVTDGANRILKLSPTGTFLSQWGTKGSGAGQMSSPQDVAFSSGGGDAVYVLDQDNRRVDKFGTDGTWLGSFGSRGTGNGQFSGAPARGLAVDPQGNVFAGDIGGNRILHWSADGTALKSLGNGQPYYRTGPLDLFYGPRGLTFVDGHLYICDMWGFRVLEWTPDGAFASQMGGVGPPLDGHSWPRGVTVDAAGNVYVSDRWHEWIQKFAPDGTLLARWGLGRGSAPGTLNFPGGIDVDDAHGFLYIANRETYVIDRWKLSDGSFDKRFTLPGGPVSGKAWPKDVAVTASGVMYVADYNNRQVDVVQPTGHSVVINTWGAPAKAMGNAGSVALDATGNMYVADTSGKMIHVYDPNNVWLRSFSTAESPAGVTVAGGNVYVLGRTVYVYSTTGVLLTHFGSVGAGDARFNMMYVGIAVDSAGNIYVADTGNHRVKVFSPA